MRYSSRVFSALVALTPIALPFAVRTGVAQTTETEPAQRKFTSATDISLGVFGQLTQSRIPNTVVQADNGVFTTEKSQSASPSAGVLGTLHQQFTPWLGYNVNLGYTRLTENYAYGTAYVPSPTSPFKAGSSFSQAQVGTNMYETTIALVALGPRTRRFTTFGQFGGGGLWFLPNTQPDATNEQTRPAMLFGVGMNYRFTEHLGLRAEYRGIFYKSPDFGVTSNIGPVTRLFTVTNEPTVSLTYTFRARRTRAR